MMSSTSEQQAEAFPPYRLSRTAIIFIELAIPVGWFVYAALASPHLHRFEINSDEGLNLIKGFLLGRGDELYRSVWSDQPPLFTHALRLLWTATGETVFASRMFVLTLTSVLMWACARYARLTWGPGEAVLAPLLLLLTPGFQQLSVSVMIGLPAIALAALAVVAAGHWNRSRRPWLSVACGVLLALSMLTKLFTGVLLPVVIAMFFAGSGRRGLRPALVCGGAFAAVMALGFAFLIGPDVLNQLIMPHLSASMEDLYRTRPYFEFPFEQRRLWLLGALALIGIITSIVQKRHLAHYATGWTILAFTALMLHRPVWYHHVPLVTVPASLLGAAGFGILIKQMARRWPRHEHAMVRVTLVMTVIVCIGLVARDGAHDRRWIRHRSSGEDSSGRLLVELLRRHSTPDRRMLTDIPMVAFRAGLRVPPDTAVLSAKRFNTGNITEAGLLETMRRSRPDFVLLGRFGLPVLSSAVREDYRLVWSRLGMDLFVAPGASACVWPRCLDQAEDWYGSSEARSIASNIVAAQHVDGGWAKNEDRTFDPYPSEDCAPNRLESCSSIDNSATTAEMWFLARVIRATGERSLVHSFESGLEFLLASQLPSGGWAQVPVAPVGDYRAAITLNDGALQHVMDLVRSVATDPLFGFVSEERRAASAEAFTCGIDLLLRTQLRNGTKSGWCGQYDPSSLLPVAGRRFEPPALGSEDSASALLTLMSVSSPSAEIVDAVEAGVRWLESSRIAGGGDLGWARFYDLRTGAPIFPDRNGVVHTRFESLSSKRRAGYRYFTDVPRSLLEDDYPRWRAALGDDAALSRFSP